VVPVFQAQIAAGGPVKVTHPDVRRFFMTISEAVSLVIQAWYKSQGSEIFVLDMGEPIRIVDLAENMIRLSGMVPYEDIDIQFTGLRPGEKLLEEISGKNEGVFATCHEKMCVIREEPLSWDTITGWIEELEDLINARQEEKVIAHIRRLVPEYNPVAKPTRDQSAENAFIQRVRFDALPPVAARRLAVRDREANANSDEPARRNGASPPMACEH
jgi:FlaA1/EpsC-like NDP-sugar epimerase